MRYKIQQFMYGRNGIDSLGRFTFVLFVITSFVGSKHIPYLSYVSVLLLLIFIYRTLSRNSYKRHKENSAYLTLKQKVGLVFSKRRKNKNSYNTKVQCYCPSCNQLLSVPSGLNKIKITCPKCNTVFMQKSWSKRLNKYAFYKILY